MLPAAFLRNPEVPECLSSTNEIDWHDFHQKSNGAIICTLCLLLLKVRVPFTPESALCLNPKPDTQHHFHLVQHDTEPSDTEAGYSLASRGKCCFCDAQAELLTAGNSDFRQFLLDKRNIDESSKEQIKYLLNLLDTCWLEANRILGKELPRDKLVQDLDESEIDKILVQLGFEKVENIWSMKVERPEVEIKLVQLEVEILRLVRLDPTLTEKRRFHLHCSDHLECDPITFTLIKSVGGCSYSFPDYTNQASLLEQRVPFKAIGCIDSTPDNVIIWAYRKAFQEDRSRQQELNEVLFQIAAIRNSVTLTEEATNVSDQPEEQFTLETAYVLLRVEATADDEIVRVAFDVACADNPTEKAKYEEALRTIAVCRKSDPLVAYCVEARILDAVQLSQLNKRFMDPLMPVGLKNTGNNCYLNCLLQLYFSIRPLRDTILCADLHRPPPPKVDLVQWETATEFIRLLRKLFANLIWAEASSITVPDELIAIALRQDHQEEVGEQQDISESMTRMLDLMSLILKTQKTIKGIPVPFYEVDAVSKFFSGKIVQLVSHEDAKTGRMVSTEKTESFYSFLLSPPQTEESKKSPMTTPASLNDCIESYFDIGLVDLEGGKAVRSISVLELPPILTFQIQRVQFDKETGQAFKSNEFIRIPPVIYMDQYLSSNFERLLKIRTRIKEIQLQKKQFIEVIGQMAAVVLQEGNEAPNAIDDLNNDLMSLEDELISLTEQLPKKHAYRLHAVMMHQGRADFGHYWTYICDESTDPENHSDSLSTSSLSVASNALSHLKNRLLTKLSPDPPALSQPSFKADKFLQFNDAEVKTVPGETVFNDPSANGMEDASAFCLVYVPLDSNYVQSRCRSKQARSSYADFRPTENSNDSLFMPSAFDW